MESGDEVGQTCPIPTPTALKRLSEAHRWWHGCVDGYDDPPTFQANLHACLQALRNVTWVLQKEHDLVPGFDSWYPEWQDRFRRDDTMRWLVKSRNRVVKSGDLEILSTARLRIISTYDDLAKVVSEGLPETGKIEDKVRDIPPWTRPSQYEKWMPPRLVANSTLLVERRWVDRALPESEILDSLAHCFGELSQLLRSAHERAGAPYTIYSCDRDETPREAAEAHSKGGRLPCMVSLLSKRTAQYRLGDGSFAGGEYRSEAIPSGRTLERSLKRYGTKKLSEGIAKTQGQLLEYVDPLLDQAKRILKEDKFHAFVVLYYKGANMVHLESGMMVDRASKFSYSQEIARQVATRGADGVVTIGEVWQSSPVLDEDGIMIPPAEVADRREAIQVTAEDRYGKKSAKACFFRRRFGRIVFEEEIELGDEMENNFMAPVRAVWSTWDS